MIANQFGHALGQIEDTRRGTTTRTLSKCGAPLAFQRPGEGEGKGERERDREGETERFATQAVLQLKGKAGSLILPACDPGLPGADGSQSICREAGDLLGGGLHECTQLLDALEVYQLVHGIHFLTRQHDQEFQEHLLLMYITGRHRHQRLHAPLAEQGALQFVPAGQAQPLDCLQGGQPHCRILAPQPEKQHLHCHQTSGPLYRE